MLALGCIGWRPNCWERSHDTANPREILLRMVQFFRFVDRCRCFVGPAREIKMIIIIIGTCKINVWLEWAKVRRCNFRKDWKCLPQPFLWIRHRWDCECGTPRATTYAANVRAKPAHIRIAMDYHKYLNLQWCCACRPHPNCLHSDRNCPVLNWPHCYSIDRSINAKWIAMHRKWSVENRWFECCEFLALNCRRAQVQQTHLLKWLLIVFR